MRKLHLGKTVNIPSDQVATLEIGTNVLRAEVDVLIGQEHFVAFQPPWAAQDKAPDEKCPHTCTRRGGAVAEEKSTHGR